MVCQEFFDYRSLGQIKLFYSCEKTVSSSSKPKLNSEVFTWRTESFTSWCVKRKLVELGFLQRMLFKELFPEQHWKGAWGNVWDLWEFSVRMQWNILLYVVLECIPWWCIHVEFIESPLKRPKSCPLIVLQ